MYFIIHRSGDSVHGCFVRWARTVILGVRRTFMGRLVEAGCSIFAWDLLWMGLHLRERAQVKGGKSGWLRDRAIKFVLALFYDGLEVLEYLEVVFTWRQHRGVLVERLSMEGRHGGRIARRTERGVEWRCTRGWCNITWWAKLQRPLSSVVERATRNGEVGCSIQPAGTSPFAFCCPACALVRFARHRVQNIPAQPAKPHPSESLFVE